MYSVSWETTLRDSSASARQRPPRASVSLVLAVFGPPSAHGCYHNAVHVEPGLPQGCCVGLAQTTLQHVEKGLTHSLKKPKTNKHTGIKQCFFFLIYKKICVNVWQAAICGSYGKRLRVDSHCLMLSAQVEQKVLQGVKVVQVADCSIDHKHHLESRIDAQHRLRMV